MDQQANTIKLIHHSVSLWAGALCLANKEEREGYQGGGRDMGVIKVIAIGLPAMMTDTFGDS